MNQPVLSSTSNYVRLQKQEMTNLSSKSYVHRYIEDFRSTYGRAMKKNYALSVKLIPFKGGKIIDSHVVEKDKAQLIELEKVGTVYEALSLAGYDITAIKDAEGKSPKGTFFIFGDNQITLIKDNSYKEWKKHTVNKDVNNIIYKIFKNNN